MFKRKTDAAPAPALSVNDAVQQARTRARQRLIGAVVLLVIGVIGFPLVFENQPRPIPLDIPIDIPKKESAPPLVMPAERPSADASSSPQADAANAAARDASTGRVAAATAGARDAPAKPGGKPREEVITETQADAGHEVSVASGRAAPASNVVAATLPVVPAATLAQGTAPPASASAPARRVADTAVPPTSPGPVDKAATLESERARSLLEGKPVATAEPPRYVVQVGAFAEADAARDVRLKIEKLGMKTYTQIAQTPSGSRIRVRVGPFASRDEADRALAKARAAGIAANVLTL